MMDKEEIKNALFELKHSDGEGFAELIIDVLFTGINGRCSEIRKAFLEKFFNIHRYLQSEMFGIFFSLCCEIDNKSNEKEMWFDPRNEHIVRLAKKIIK